MEKPITEWNNNTKKAVDPLDWIACVFCGEEFPIIQDEEAKNDEFVCKECNKKEQKMIRDMISQKKTKLNKVYCRRHHKSIEVEASWIETCSYLCPQCYNKLTPKERAKYANKSKKTVEVKQKAAKTPKVVQKKEKKEKAVLKVSKDGITRDDTNASKYGFKLGYSLADLKPKYKIKCQKCGKEWPCHYSWYDKSTVLCPECYGSMTKDEIEMFHEEHKADKPLPMEDVNHRSENVTNKPVKSLEPKIRKTAAEYREFDRHSNVTIHGGRLSETSIRAASIETLERAVKKGALSAVRLKIEKKRRQNKEYYDSYPDESIRVISFR